jgi:hypothetical protein
MHNTKMNRDAILIAILILSALSAFFLLFNFCIIVAMQLCTLRRYKHKIDAEPIIIDKKGHSLRVKGNADDSEVPLDPEFNFKNIESATE